MERKIHGKAVFISLFSLAIGAIIGFSLNKGIVVPNGYPQLFPSAASVRDAVLYVISTCAGFMLQAFLLFTAGSLRTPSAVVLPLMMFRGCALGFCAKSLSSASSPEIIIAVISYTVISGVYVFLSCKAYEKASAHTNDIKSIKNLSQARYVYSFMTACGASLFIKILPQIVYLKLR